VAARLIACPLQILLDHGRSEHNRHDREKESEANGREGGHCLVGQRRKVNGEFRFAMPHEAFLLLALFPFASASAPSNGLVDHPIAASAVQYLDGSDWTVSATIVPARTADCDFEANVDYNHGVVGPHVGASSQVWEARDVLFNLCLTTPLPPQADCCVACAKVPDCAAAVFATKGKSCWLKTSADLSKKSSVPDVTACVVKASPSSKGKQAPSHPTQPPRASCRARGGAQVSIPARVPGDLLTDLERAGLIGDPLYELNWLNSSIWDTNAWTYKTEFVAEAAGETLLTFDGIKMGAK